MMQQHTYPPKNYRAESVSASRFWWVWLPYIVAIAMIVIAFLNPEFMSYWLINEKHGLVEFMHFAFPAAIAVMSIYMLTLKSTRASKLNTAWCIALTVGAIYLAGEEASWGQHYVGWTTSEFWAQVNDQQETNLHNTSYWLDQKPRLILLLGIVITGIFMPWVLLNKPEIPPRSMDFTYTPLALVPLACLVFISWFYKDIVDLMGLYDTIRLRGGEYQETFITWYLFGYSLFLVHRARNAERWLHQT